MSAAASRQLLAVCKSFPGIVTARCPATASHLHPPADDAAQAVVVLVFENNTDGKTAQWVVDFIMARVNGARAPGLACGCATPKAVFYGCTSQQLDRFQRYLNYASPRPMGYARPPAVLAKTPLSVLLSHAQTAFTRDYGDAISTDRSKPPLGVWSNFLRVIDDQGLDPRQLSKLAILSPRSVRPLARDLERQGWLTVERPAAGAPKVRGLKILRLTATGRRARDAGPMLIDDVEKHWRERFGEGRVDALRAALAAVANQFQLALPYYLTGYGPSDGSITGGAYLAEDPGPPYIPARGEEWPVVLRDPADDTSELPLSALLSMVLAGFAIDYERERLGMLGQVSNLLQFVGNDGMTLERASARASAGGHLGSVTGDGKSGPERHLWVIAEPGRLRDRKRRFYLTPKGIRARDSYPHLVMEIERNWRARYGGGAVGALRAALEALDDELGAGLPSFPNTTTWFQPGRWWHAGKP